MKGFIRTAAVAMLLLMVGSATAEAQSWKFDIGAYGGYAWWSSMLDEGHLASAEDGGEIGFGADWLTGTQLTVNLSPRFGLRGNFSWAEPNLERFDTEFVEDINRWALTGDLMIRFAQPAETFAGTEFLPYLALGFGATKFNPAGGFINFEGERSGEVFNADGNWILVGEAWKPTWLAALGGDLRLSPNFGLRLEVGDRITDAPLYALTGTPGAFTLAEGPDEDLGNTMHEVYGSIGLHLLMGLAEPEIVAVEAAPPPPPPAPAPEEPVEEAITVCVIDPTAPAGVRALTATYLPATRDTMVMVNGRRVPIEEGVGTITVAGDVEWFVAGQPMVLDIERQRTEFVTFGTSRIIERDLAFIGTVNGLPVYAANSDVADIREELDELNAAGGDLDEILEQRDDLREEFDEIDVLYVPLQPVGCVFQPLQRVEEVRKGGK